MLSLLFPLAFRNIIPYFSDFVNAEGRIYSAFTEADDTGIRIAELILENKTVFAKFRNDRLAIGGDFAIINLYRLRRAQPVQKR